MFNRFFRSEVSGSIVLMACTIVALTWSNSPWSQSYTDFTHIKVGFSWGGASLDMSLQHWINDALMAIFFFVVGLEVKREILIGQLSTLRKAALPVSAAVGGMLVPAGVYFAMNAGEPGAQGWGIPMATDIAFALGLLALFGSRAPIGLKVFLTALAIADDIGAVLVIAFFYTGSLKFGRASSSRCSSRSGQRSNPKSSWNARKSASLNSNRQLSPATAWCPTTHSSTSSTIFTRHREI
jgi:NhaA family Na+:H+ antiporter